MESAGVSPPLEKRTHIPFGRPWGMPIEIPYSMLVMDHGLGWTCGQLPLDLDSNVLAPDDLARQTEIVCDHIVEVLHRGSVKIDSIGKIHLYFVQREPGDAEKMVSICKARFGNKALLIPIAVPHFYYVGLLLEADVFCGPACATAIENSGDGSLVRVVECGNVVWASINASLSKLDSTRLLLEQALSEFGIGLECRLSDHWFVAGDQTETSEFAAFADGLKQMNLISDDGALTTGHYRPGEAIGELTFVKGAPSDRKTKVYEAADVLVTGRKIGRLGWLSARSLDGSQCLNEQTAQVMKGIDQALSEFGASFADVVKSTCHYVGGSSPAELHGNMGIRNRYYTAPGPASTGLPVFGYSDPRSRTIIDVYFSHHKEST